MVIEYKFRQNIQNLPLYGPVEEAARVKLVEIL